MEENTGRSLLHKPAPPRRQQFISSSSYNLGTVSFHGDFDGSGRKKLLKRSPQAQGSVDGCFYDVVGILVKHCPDNYEFWCARRMIAGQLGINNAATKSCELKFTEEILLMFPRNKLAWAYRQWIYEKNGGVKNDLAFYDKLLKNDSYNKFAWNQRLFLVTKFDREAGAAEAEFAIKAILDGPENEYPWIYLRSLYNSKVARIENNINIKLDGLFTSVIAFNAASRLQPPHTRPHLGGRERVRDLQINVVMNRKILVNALETLPCLTAGFDGYRIRTPVCDAVYSVRLDTMRFIECIYSTLQFADPLRAPYWKRRMDHAKKLDWYSWDTADRTRSSISCNEGVCFAAMAAEESTKRLREVLMESSGHWPNKVDEVTLRIRVQPGHEMGLVCNVAFASTISEIKQYLDCYSTQSLDITLKAIALNNENRWVWKFRQIILDKIGHDLREELDLMRSFAKVAKVKYIFMWKHRLHLVKRLGMEATKEELDFTKNILADDLNNKDGWHHMVKLCSLIGYKNVRKELDFTEKIFSVDANFSEAWDYRESFIEMLPVDDIRYDYNMIEQHLLQDAKNVKAWDHRRRLVLELKIDVSKELEFSSKVIENDAHNNFAWSHRQWVVQYEARAVSDELEFTKGFLLWVDAKNHYVWSYRRWIYETLGGTDATALKELGIYDVHDLSLTERILYEDAQNDYAWYHRQWFIKAFGGWEYEINFCNEILAKHTHNEHAWAQRLFVFTGCGQEMLKVSREVEVSYGLRAAVKEPSNECPWKYLRGIYQQCNDSCCDDMISTAIEDVLLQHRAKDGRRLMGTYIILDEEIYANALVTILDLIYHGYHPSQGVQVVIANLNATLINVTSTNVDNGKSISGLANDIFSILQYVDLLDKYDWKWRMKRIRDIIGT